MSINRTKAAECGDKQAHSDKQDALGRRAAMIRGGSPAWRLAVYRCQHCNAWHIGHRPKPKKNRR